MPENVIVEPAKLEGMSTRTKVILIAVTGGVIALAAVGVGLVLKRRHQKAHANSNEQVSHE